MDIYINKCVNDRIKSDLSDFKYNKNLEKDMDYIIYNDAKIKISAVKIVIKDMNISNIISSYNDPRISDVIELVKRSLDYAKRNGLKVNDTYIYFYSCDVYVWEYQEYPFFVYSKPKNKKGILFPDHSFIRNKISTISSWNKQKSELIKSVIQNPNKKINKIYFYGGGGDISARHKYRHKLRDLHLPNMEIHIRDKWKSMTTLSKYKYLLNLPGVQPWSNRFKYLFLTKSLVINVNLLQTYIYKSGKIYKNLKYINFYDNLFIPNRDYIDIDVEYVEERKNNYKIYNEKQFKKSVDKIEKVYNFMEKNEKLYSRMVNNAYKKVNLITEEIIYKNMIKLMNEYTEKLINPK